MDDLGAVGVTPQVLPYMGAPHERSGVVQIGYVGLKLIGIYFILQILNISWLLEMLAERGRIDWHSVWINVLENGLPTMLQTVVGLIIYRKAERWSPRIFGVPNSIVAPIGREDAMILIIAGIGLLLFTTGLPGLAENLATIVMPDVMLGPDSAAHPSIRLWIRLITDSGLRVMIGAIMFIFSRNLAGLWRRRLDSN